MNIDATQIGFIVINGGSKIVIDVHWKHISSQETFSNNHIAYPNNDAPYYFIL